MFALYKTENALGTLPFGQGAFGGGPAKSTPDNYELLSDRRVKVYALPEFAGKPEIIRHSKYQSALRYPGSATNLLLKMR